MGKKIEIDEWSGLPVQPFTQLDSLPASKAEQRRIHEANIRAGIIMPDTPKKKTTAKKKKAK